MGAKKATHPLILGVRITPIRLLFPLCGHFVRKKSEIKETIILYSADFGCGFQKKIGVTVCASVVCKVTHSKVSHCHLGAIVTPL